MSKIISNIKNFFYPTLKCPLCKGFSEGLCIKCRDELMIYEETTLDECQEGVSIYSYNQAAKDLIASYKKKKEFSSGEAIASLMAERLKSEMGNIDLITCAPSSIASLKTLGFDHGAHLIKLISKEIGIPWALLFDPSFTVQKGLDKEERMANVLTINLKKEVWRKFQGKRILIIDDVYTTGSTINRCTSLLREKKAPVKYMTFSRL